MARAKAKANAKANTLQGPKASLWECPEDGKLLRLEPYQKRERVRCPCCWGLMAQVSSPGIPVEPTGVDGKPIRSLIQTERWRS